MSGKYYYFIDVIKTIAIFFVILYHCGDLSNHPIFVNDFVRSILSSCVPLFFLANGLLLLNKPLDIKKHISKIINIALLTIVWGAIVLFIEMYLWGEFLSPSAFIMGLFQLKQGWINYLWFMEALVVIYVFFPLIKQVYDTNRKFFMFFLAAVFIFTFLNKFLAMGEILFSAVTGLSEPNKNFNFFFSFNPFRGIYGYSLVYFMLGGLLFEKKANFTGKKSVAYAIWGLMVAALLATIYWHFANTLTSEKYVYNNVWDGYDSIFTLVITVAIFIISLHLPKIKLVTVIGNQSLGIYLVHRVLVYASEKYYTSLHFAGYLPAAVVYSLLILFVSLGVCLVATKIPVLRKLFSFK